MKVSSIGEPGINGVTVLDSMLKRIKQRIIRSAKQLVSDFLRRFSSLRCIQTPLPDC